MSIYFAILVIIGCALIVLGFGIMVSDLTGFLPDPIGMFIFFAGVFVTCLGAMS